MPGSRSQRAVGGVAVAGVREMELHVGLFQLGPRLDEAVDDAGGEGQDAAAAT